MNNTTTAKERVSVLLPSLLIKEVKKTSRQKGVTQSFIIKNALEFWFKNRLRQDAQILSQITFDDLPSENEWLSLQPTIN